ncbi:MAG: hypothetical protein PVSMB7_06110 [Chloroflexota bacterium]
MDNLCVSRETTLSKVDDAIAAGDFGLARDRLQGLLASYPTDLTLRVRLGEVYWNLRNPSMAGRYWYLWESDVPEVAAAKEAFERACGNSAQRILQHMKFKGAIEDVNETYARRVLDDLQRRAAEERRPADSIAAERDQQREFRAAVSFYSCLFIAASTVLLFVMGIVFVLSKFIH